MNTAYYTVDENANVTLHVLPHRRSYGSNVLLYNGGPVEVLGELAPSMVVYCFDRNNKGGEQRWYAKSSDRFHQSVAGHGLCSYLYRLDEPVRISDCHLPNAPIMATLEQVTLAPNLRQLQTTLPWTIRYSRDFRASPMSHKDMAHALHHVGKAAGRLHGLVDDMDHDRSVADEPDTREQYGKYVADLVICALRIANTFPGGVLDLQDAVEGRIKSKNAKPAKNTMDYWVHSNTHAVAGYWESVSADASIGYFFPGQQPPSTVNQAYGDMAAAAAEMAAAAQSLQETIDALAAAAGKEKQP